MSEERASSKAKEYSSTGIMLVIVGTVGLVLNTLNFVGMIHIPILSKAYLNFTVLSVLLVVFVIFGISSIRNAKKFQSVGEEQDLWEERALTWAREHMTQEIVDSYVYEEENLFEESKTGENDLEELDAEVIENNLVEKAEFGDDASYYVRAAKMKAMLVEQFGVIDDAVLEDVVEILYDSIFEMNA